MLDEATKRGSVSHDQNSFSGGNIRSDRLEPEGHRSLDEVLEGLVEWEVRLRDGGEQLAISWQLKRANLKPPEVVSAKMFPNISWLEGAVGRRNN